MNGLDVNQSWGNGNLFVVDQGSTAQAGKLFRIPHHRATGAAGTITGDHVYAQPLKHPDGLKVIAPNLPGDGRSGGRGQHVSS